MKENRLLIKLPATTGCPSMISHGPSDVAVSLFIAMIAIIQHPIVKHAFCLDCQQQRLINVFCTQFVTSGALSLEVQSFGTYKEVLVVIFSIWSRFLAVNMLKMSVSASVVSVSLSLKQEKSVKLQFFFSLLNHT